MKIIQFLLIAFVSFSCSEPQQQISTEHAVYESVFAYIIRDANKPIVLAKVTGVSKQGVEHFEKLHEQRFVDFQNRLIKAPEGLLLRFYTINEEPKIVDWKPIMVNVEKWIPHEYSQADSRVTHYQVSKVAISDNNQHAIVNISHNCYVLCGGSYLVYLKKIGNRWEITASSTLWVS